MTILDGKKIAREIKQELKLEVLKMPSPPGLAAVLVGNNEASRVYVGLKEKACQEVGIIFFRHDLPEDIPEAELLRIIRSLNEDKKIHGILVQLPLPKHLHANNIIRAISPHKDADGFHPENVRLLQQGKPRVIQPPVAAALGLLEATLQDLTRLTAVILANSQEFALPLQLALGQRGIKSASLIRQSQFSLLTQKADIVISAIGQPHLIQATDIKKNAILIDVGFSKIDDKIMGDFDPASVKDTAAFLSPVPGGVGPMTVAYLLANVVKLAKNQKTEKYGKVY